MRAEFNQAAPKRAHQITGAMCSKARKKAGLTQREVAKGMGISVPYLSDLENGNRGWTEQRFEAFNKSLQRKTK